MFWDVFTITMIIAALFAGREYKIIRGRAALQNWGSFPSR